MALDDVASCMLGRMPWPIARLVLEEHDLPRGRGRDNTAVKLVQEAATHPEAEEALVEALRQHLLCGEKYTRFFALKKSAREQLADRLTAAKIEDSAAKRRYPLLLSEDEIATEPSGAQLIAVEAVEAGVHAIFSSIRFETLRETIDEGDLPQDAKDALSDYQEVIGVKHVRTQAIDVVYVPFAQRHVDVRIDYREGTSTDHVDYAGNLLSNFINNVAGEEVLQKSVNLFPLINHIYASSKEGKVVELAFGTTTKSIKHEKMRRGAIDLRQENYHKGGKAALTTSIEPHKLSVEYRRSIGRRLHSAPELTLASSYRMAASPTPVLDGAIIRNCCGSEDFHFVQQRLRHFLKQDAPDQ